MLNIGLDSVNEIDDVFIERKMVEAVWVGREPIQDKPPGCLPRKITYVKLISGRNYTVLNSLEDVVKRLDE